MSETAGETYILFEVGGAVYAVRSAQVMQVEMVDQITRVPNAPDFVEGVVSVRGQVIPVVSLRARFRLPPAERDLRARLIVIRLDDRFIGMLVDSAREFIHIAEDTIQPPPEDMTGPMVHYLDGVAVQPKRLVLIVNLARLFSSQEHEALTESPQA